MCARVGLRRLWDARFLLLRETAPCHDGGRCDLIGMDRANRNPTGISRREAVGGARLSGGRLPPSIGLARDLAGDVDLFVVREAPGRNSEANG